MFEIKGITIKGSGYRKFTHRDILGSLLSLGAVEMIFSKYMLGASFNEMIATFYRPFIYTCAGIFFGVVGIAWLVHHFVFSDKKGLIIRADDKHHYTYNCSKQT